MWGFLWVPQRSPDTSLVWAMAPLAHFTKHPPHSRAPVSPAFLTQSIHHPWAGDPRPVPLHPSQVSGKPAMFGCIWSNDARSFTLKRKQFQPCLLPLDLQVWVKYQSPNSRDTCKGLQIILLKPLSCDIKWRWRKCLPWNLRGWTWPLLDEHMSLLSHSVMSDSARPHGLYSLPGSSVHGDSAGQNTGVGSHSLLQQIKPGSPSSQANSLWSEPPGKPMNTTVGSLSLLLGGLPYPGTKLGLLHCRQILYQLSY